MGSRISTAYRAEKVRMRLYNDQIEEDFRENITLLLLGMWFLFHDFPPLWAFMPLRTEIHTIRGL